MPVLVGSLSDLGLNCLIFAGRVSRSEALGFPARISSIGEPSHWVQPQPAVTTRV